MAKRLGKFEIPKRLAKVENSATNTYAMFIAEPFEIGYAHTIGNALRRVLLSSIEGAAIASIRIEGVQHELSVRSPPSWQPPSSQLRAFAVAPVICSGSRTHHPEVASTRI